MFVSMSRQCLQVYAPQLDGGRIAACVQGDVGAALMHRNAQLTEALDPPHQYVPWIVINGVLRPGGGLGGSSRVQQGDPLTSSISSPPSHRSTRTSCRRRPRPRCWG